MKTRRFLAALLSLAMIVTSAGFSADVYAQETQEIVVSAIPGTDDAEALPGVAEDGEEASGQDEAGLGDADTDTDNGEAEATVPEAGVEEEMPVEGEDAPAVENPDENAGEEELGEEDPEAETFDNIAEDPYGENGGVLELTGVPVTSDTAILPEGTTTIPAGIFDQGSDAQAVTRIDFTKCANTLDTIDQAAFKGSKIKSIELPAGVTVINKGVFQNCTDLVSISGTSNLTSIDENAFMDSGLTGIIIPSVTAIGDNAFRDCADLAQVELRDAESIGQGAFRGCSKLASGMVWSEKIKDIGERAFCGCGFVNLDLSLLELALGDKVTMGSYAFADNEKLTSIVVPKELDEIPAHAFENCKKLATFTMESFNTGDENVTSKVGAFAFANCVALKAIKLGNHIATIDNDAFRGCTALSDISLYYTGNNDGLHPIDIAESAFPERNNRANAFISSYDDTVEAYADRRGYTYKLLGAHAVQPYISGYGAISTKGNQAAEGKLVRLTVTPKAGFALKWNTLRVVKKSDGTPIATNLESFTKATQIFTFIMPGEDVKIEAEFLETKKAITGELLIRVDDSIIENKGTITIDKVGATKQLEASDTAGGRLGLWNFDFASSNPSIMTVSPMGVITGLKQGIAELSVTPTGMKAKAQKFRVEVAAPTTIRAIHFDQFLSTGADPDNPLVPQSLYDNDFTAPDEPYRNPLIPNAWVYPVGYVDQYGLGDATYYVVEYEQSTVAANAQSFKPFFIATEDADGDDGYDDTTGKYENNLFATANWTSSDPNIVKTSASKTYTNDVTINIPKGAKGTALIRATVPNDDPDFPTAGPAGFIVRIRDRSPRLYGKYTVNTNNPNGTELKLTTVYGTRIDHSTGLTVCTKTVNKKSGQVEYVESPDLRVDPDDTDPRSDPANDIAIYYIKANKTAKPQTYKDKLYLVGQYTDNGHYFYTPIPELQIVDTSVKPKLTYQSKINLFYNRSGNNAVLLRHGLNGVKIDYAKTTLISAANYPTVTGPDDLKANFEIVTAANAMNPEDAKLVSDDKVIVIKLNRALGDQNEGLKKKGNKVVTDGVLKLWFVGYDTPFYLKVSIPVVNVVPGYVFDKVSAGASPRNKQAQFALRLVDSATKIKPLYLYEHDSKYRKADGTIDYKKEEADGKPADGDLLIADIRYNQAQTTDNLFDMDNDALQDPVFNKKDQIPIKLSATRRKNKGTAAIALRLKTWARPVTYKFTVTETKDPTMTFKPVTLNKEVVYASGIATPKINQKEWIQTGYDTDIEPDDVKKAVIEADGIDFIYTGPQTPTAIDNAAKVIDLVTLNDDFSIQFDLPAYESADWEDLVAGTYNFQVIPKGKFGDGGTVFYLGRTNLQVKVVKNKPVFRLTSASFTLNPAFAGEGDVNSEGVITKTSLTNVPAGYTYKVAEDQNLEFYKVTDVKLEHEVANPYGKFSGTDIPAPSKADPNRTLQTGVRAELDNDPPAQNATYSYLVKGFTVEIWPVDENGDPTGAASLGELEFAEMRVNFITKVVEPTLRVTSVGTINQIDSRSAITYTFTTNGINNGTITSMKVQELMPNNEFGPEDDPDGHFVIKPAEDKDGNEIRNTYKLTLNLNNVLGDGAGIDPVQYGQKYTLKLNYTLDETGGTAGETFTHRLTVTPSQKVAAMSLLKTSAYTYSGAEDQNFEIFVRQTSIAGAEIDDVNLNEQTPDVPAGIRILPTTGMNIKEAFTIAAVSKQYATLEDEWYYNTTEKKFMQLTDEDEAAIEAGEMAAPLSVKLDDNGKPVYDENKKPIYGFTVTLQLAHPGILPVDKYYKVPIEIRYKYQNVKTRGNVLTFVPTVYK